MSRNFVHRASYGPGRSLKLSVDYKAHYKYLKSDKNRTKGDLGVVEYGI